MSTFKAEYQKYLDKLKGVDLTSKTSTLTSNVTSCVNNMNNLKSSVSASTWTELGEETFANSVIPSVSTFTSGLSDNIATLEKAASMSKELVDIIEELKTAVLSYRLMKELGPYMINIKEHDYNVLEGYLIKVNGVNVLDYEYMYSQETGLKMSLDEILIK